MDLASKVAKRVLLASVTPTKVLREIRGELRKMQAWSKTFDRTLKGSKASSLEAPKGYVWQEQWVDYWDPFDPIQRRLFKLEKALDKVSPELGGDVDPFVEPPRPARIDEAISDPRFAEWDGEEQIAYSEKALVDWHKAFSWWVGYAIKGVDDLIRKHG